MTLAQAIIDACMTYYGVTLPEVISERRHVKLCRCRTAIGHLVYELAGMSYPEISMMVGRKNHSTMATASLRFKLLPEVDRVTLQELAQAAYRQHRYPHVVESRMRCAANLDALAEFEESCAGNEHQYAAMILRDEARRVRLGIRKASS